MKQKFTKQDWANACIISGVMLMVVATPVSLFTIKYLYVYLEGLAIFIMGIILD